MNDKKHTPGPWGFSGPWGWLTKEGGFSIVAGKQNEQVVICSRNSCGPDAGEMIANARLIAAAPDMLEALKNARQFISNGIQLGYIDEPAPGSPEAQTLGIIVDAIRKAEGTRR